MQAVGYQVGNLAQFCSIRPTIWSRGALTPVFSYPSVNFVLQ